MGIARLCCVFAKLILWGEFVLFEAKLSYHFIGRLSIWLFFLGMTKGLNAVFFNKNKKIRIKLRGVNVIA